MQGHIILTKPSSVIDQHFDQEQVLPELGSVQPHTAHHTPHSPGQSQNFSHFAHNNTTGKLGQL